MLRLFTILISFLFCSNLTAADCGLFRVVKGKVTYKQKNKNKFKKARINKKVCQGDTVKTEADSRTKIVMADKNELNISPNSQLTIEVYKNASSGNGEVLLDVVYGKVRSNVKQKYKGNKKSHYRVKTKSAVAGVRGTEFMASFNQQTNQSRVVTFEGEVMVGEMNGGTFVPRVSVKPGEFTSNSPGTNPHPPKEVPPQELAQIDSETNVADSPRGVADTGASSSETEPKEQKEELKNEAEKKPVHDPKADKPKPEGAKEPSANNGSEPSKPVAGTGGPSHGGGQHSEGRDLASVEGGDPMGLPPPNMGDMPQGGDFDSVFEPPKIPTLDPIIDNIPDCLTCNDAVINQKATVTIIPIIEGN